MMPSRVVALLLLLAVAQAWVPPPRLASRLWSPSAGAILVGEAFKLCRRGQPLPFASGPKEATTGEDYLIKLDQFIKFTSDLGTGGQARRVIKEGLVKVNGEIEERRGRKLRVGDVVQIFNFKLDVAKELGVEPQEDTVIPQLDPSPELEIERLPLQDQGGEMKGHDNVLELDDAELLAMESAVGDLDTDEDDPADEDLELVHDDYDEATDATDGDLEKQLPKWLDESTKLMRTKRGLPLALRRATATEVRKVAAYDWAPKELKSGGGTWLTAEVASGFAGCVGVLKLTTLRGTEEEQQSFELSALATSPPSRQRGVAGALVDFACELHPDATLRAKVPRFKNPKASKLLKKFFADRAVEVI